MYSSAKKKVGGDRIELSLPRVVYDGSPIPDQQLLGRHHGYVGGRAGAGPRPALWNELATDVTESPLLLPLCM